MSAGNVHLTDQELVLANDGEIAVDRARHLAGCNWCQIRGRELQNAAALFASANGPELPSAGPARTRLRAHLAAVAANPASESAQVTRWYAVLAGTLLAVGMIAVANLNLPVRAHRLEMPSPRLTPGAARAVNRDAVCSVELPKNQVAPADLRRRVLQEYGIAGSDSTRYEVDYLITPALGGADDVRNLWPQPYLSTVWNAHVKDELEDRLRELVCGGHVDLAEAQRDISTNWIAAYKKYFGTDRPVR
ncbi:MAG TPA: hypothetical protein VHW09_10095 [Bryobacteraceae bacterium]|nr:hypothetical protein [Bryobacteraceae bacterium]